MDCRNVDVGVMGERNESTSSSGGVGFSIDGGLGMWYVRLVDDASKFAPRYVANETLYLWRFS